MPIGAIVEDPAGAALPEFTLTRESDSSIRVRTHRAGQVTIRKKFSFARAEREKRQLSRRARSRCVRTAGHSRTRITAYFSRSARPRRFIQRIIRTYTRLVWSIDGNAKRCET